MYFVIRILNGMRWNKMCDVFLMIFEVLGIVFNYNLGVLYNIVLD